MLDGRHFSDVRFGSLFDYIIVKKFRTISPDIIHVPCGEQEIMVEINLKKETMDKLSFLVQWDGIILGYSRNKAELSKKLSIQVEPKQIMLIDWGENFLLMVILKDDTEIPVCYFQTDELVELLENCLRAPIHCIQKK